jgi:hypothetical protein
MVRSLGLAAAVAAILVVLFPSCSSDVGSTFCEKDCGPDASVDGGDGNVMPFNGADHGAPQSLSITPANATLAVSNPGSPPTEQLVASVTFGDGTTAPETASWTLDRFDIASIGSGTGLVQPTGTVFGKITVTANAEGLQATTTLTVTFQGTVNLGNISSADASQLADATTSDPDVISLAYPYDGTVFPTGLVAPVTMWNYGLAGDEYEVHYVGPDIDLAVLTTADPPSQFTLPQALWNTLVSTAAGSDVTVELRRLSSGQAYLCTSETWHIANANLRGLVYFWNISQGQVLKADLTVGTVSPVFQPGSSGFICGTNPCGSGNPRALNSGLPQSPPWEDNGLGDRCVACHSVSKDGSTMAATFSVGGSSGPSGFIDLSTTLINAIGDYTATGMFTAIAPDGAWSVMNSANKTMQLVNGASGMGTASALDGLTNLCDPAFSPDGTLFAAAANCTGGTNFVLEFSQSDLVLYDFAESTQTFSNARTLLTGAAPSDAGVATGTAGSALAFPSVTPDSKWVVFQGGDYSRAKYGTYQHGNDDLYVISTQTGSAPISLDAANGTSYLPPDSQHLNYAPTVSPILAGGYYWVVFTSPRDYGNIMVSPEQAPPNDATYANHKQLWVTAIDASVGATDPSHPAFWLPGQDATTANMFGYWTLAPCKDTLNDAGPSTCETGFECCSGFCRDTGMGFVCVNNPGGCSQDGETCTATSDCCGASTGSTCAAGICQSGVQ